MEKNKDNGCIKMLINLIASHKKVKSWDVDSDNNTLVIKLEEELGVYDIDVFNHFLSDLNEEDVFESNAKFEHHKEDYATIFTKLKKETKVKFYCYGANGTTDPRRREGSNQICSECGCKFSFWDDLQLRPTDEKLKCANCKGIKIDLITKPPIKQV